MDRNLLKNRIAKRVAQELHDGDVVNLGIGLPSLVSNYIPEDYDIILHGENGILGMGEIAEEGEIDYNVQNAGATFIHYQPGAMFINSTQSFEIIRGGHIDATVLGAFQVDVYVSSANALSIEGDIINIDKSGNRVANTFYGPREVIFVIGRNKICRDIASGIQRIKEVVCPPNAKRLHAQTPCGLTGKCTNCNSPDRLCRTITIIQRPSASVDHVYILLIDEDLGI